MSYAEKLKNNVNECIIIEPAQHQSCKETEEKIKDKVDIMELGIGIDRMMKGVKGKIILGMKEKLDQQTLSRELKKRLGTGYKIYEPQKKLPKIKVIGVGEVDNVEEEELVKNISRQNRLNSNEEDFKMKISKKIGVTASEANLILETDPKTHRLLIETGKIKIGFQNCKLYDYVSVLRCYKCCGYNHFAKDCNNGMSCRKCGGEHDGRECKEKVKRCANCTRHCKKYNINYIDVEHESTDYRCPIYKNIMEKASRNIQYRCE